MNCFIASAFDHKDVDTIYDHAIRPVLRQLKLCPSRVDRVEHNDDIDDHIFKLIDQSQVCIADLTFARPSVYYEAGYAYGTGKPVIYIARRDHFYARTEDEAGNLKIHFDLQMKNIIPWVEPNETFKKRLRARLQHVLRPLFRSQKAESIKFVDREYFSSLSQNKRLATLVVKGRSLLRSRGFREENKTEIGPLRNYSYIVQLSRVIRSNYIQVLIPAFPAISKTYMEGLSWLWHSPKITERQKSVVRTINTFCIVPTLRHSHEHTLTSLLPSWTPLGNKIYTKQIVTHSDKRSHTVTVMFIDGILAQDDFTNRFRPIINRIAKGQ